MRYTPSISRVPLSSSRVSIRVPFSSSRVWTRLLRYRSHSLQCQRSESVLYTQRTIVCHFGPMHLLHVITIESVIFKITSVIVDIIGAKYHHVNESSTSWYQCQRLHRSYESHREYDRVSVNQRIIREVWVILCSTCHDEFFLVSGI